MKQEFCIRCNTKRDVKMTTASEVITDPAGKRKEIQIKTYYCNICKGFVRRENCIRGELLNTRDTFTPIAKNIWRAMPGDTQLKILNTVWCTQCQNMARITHITAKVDSGMLVLRGECARCSGDVARVIENE